jgi:hypothetical protein
MKSKVVSKLSTWWKGFRASRIRQAGTACSVLTVMSLLLVPGQASHALVVLTIPLSSWAALRMRREQEQKRGLKRK